MGGKRFILMYRGMNRVGVGIYASVTVFHEGHGIPVAEFAMGCANFHTKRIGNYLPEGVTGFGTVNGKLRLMIRGCE